VKGPTLFQGSRANAREMFAHTVEHGGERFEFVSGHDVEEVPQCRFGVVRSRALDRASSGLRESHYGPFVMNTRDEIVEAIDDYQAGRLGIVPADQLAPRNFA
jgi:hypothetical protein